MSEGGGGETNLFLLVLLVSDVADESMLSPSSSSFCNSSFLFI